jgi:hypothetical protein
MRVWMVVLLAFALAGFGIFVAVKTYDPIDHGVVVDKIHRDRTVETYPSVTTDVNGNTRTVMRTRVRPESWAFMVRGKGRKSGEEKVERVRVTPKVFYDTEVGGAWTRVQ